MKFTKVISFILKIAGYVLGFGGIIYILGSVGALEQNSITMLQCFLQALAGFGCIAVAFIIFIGREVFKYYFI